MFIKTYSSGLGNFSIAGFEVRLKRHSMKYIIYNYFPSGLFVCLSWISFLIPVEIVPGRIARSALKVSEDNIHTDFVYEVGIMFQEDQYETADRYVEITYVAHVVQVS